jgi:hypothetical protein
VSTGRAGLCGTQSEYPAAPAVFTALLCCTLLISSIDCMCKQLLSLHSLVYPVQVAVEEPYTSISELQMPGEYGGRMIRACMEPCSQNLVAA